MKIKWLAGKCIVAECEMSMVMPIGAGRNLCWLHALKFGVPLAALALTACGTDIFFISVEGGTDNSDSAEQRDAATDDAGDAQNVDGAIADAGTDSNVSADAAPADSGNGCTGDGGTACSDVMTGYCNVYATCCSQGPGNGYCPSWLNGGYYTKCRAQFADCTTSKYTSKPVCGGPTTTCQTAISSLTCNSIYQTTGPNDSAWIPGCTAFWSQF